MLFSESRTPVIVRPPIDNGRVQVRLSQHVLDRVRDRAGGAISFNYTETIKIVRGGKPIHTWLLPVQSATGYKMYLVGEWCASQTGEFDNVFRAVTLLTNGHLKITGMQILDRLKVKVVKVFKGGQYVPNKL